MKSKIGSKIQNPADFQFVFQNPQTPGQALKAKISKVRHLRAVFTVNTPTCIVVSNLIQITSDNINLDFTAEFGFYCRFWILLPILDFTADFGFYC